MKIKTFIEKIENINISFGYSILMLCFAIFLRTFLENFTNSNNSGAINGFIDTFLHYPLWFLSVFAGIIIVVSIVSGKHISKIFKLVSFGSFIIILPPIIDLLSYSHKIRYDFIIGDKIELIKQYFSLFLTTESLGIGIKIEVILVLSAIFFYVYLQKRNIFKSLLAAWLSYSIIFGMLVLPNLIYIISGLFINLPKLSTVSIQNYFFPIEISKQILITREYLSDAITGSVTFGMKQNLFSILIAQASSYIFAVFGIFSTFLYFGFKKTTLIIKNFRYLRIGHFFLLIILGIVIAERQIYQNINFSNIFDWFSIISLFASLLFAWLFSVWENDEVDREIDVLSNNERPLVNNIFSFEEWKNIKWVFFIMTLIFGTLAGYSTLIIVFVFLIIYHIYSAKPLRLKKYPIISSILVGINATLAFLLGFLFVSGIQPFNILPGGIMLGILIFYSCVENIKNLKDIKGDMSEKILTIPVIFGEEKGKFITWIIVFLGSFAIPLLVFPQNKIFFTVPFFATISYVLIVKKNYKEKPLMIFYLISFVLVLALYLI